MVKFILRNMLCGHLMARAAESYFPGDTNIPAWFLYVTVMVLILTFLMGDKNGL
jgi:hypothetical protein